MPPRGAAPQPARLSQQLVRSLRDAAVAQHPVAIALDLERQPCRRAAAARSTHPNCPAPNYRRRSRPANRRSADRAERDSRGPAAGSGPGRTGRRRPDRSPRQRKLASDPAARRIPGATSPGSAAVARFGAVDGKGDPIEIGAPRRREQVEGSVRRDAANGVLIEPRRGRAAQHGHRALPWIGETDGLGFAGCRRSRRLLRRDDSDGCDTDPPRKMLTGSFSSGKGDGDDTAMRRWRLAFAAHDPDRRQPAIGKGDDFRILRIFADQRLDLRRRPSRRLGFGRDRCSGARTGDDRRTPLLPRS